MPDRSVIRPTADLVSAKANPKTRSQRAAFGLLLVAALLSAALWISPAAPASEPVQSETLEQATSALENDQPGEGAMPVVTHPAAASGLSLAEADRSEALQTLEGVFAPLLETGLPTPAELNGADIRSPNVALLPDGSGLRPPSLLASSVPLVTESEDGAGYSPVNLRLQNTGGSFEPVNPIVPVTIPDELGEGISFQETGIAVRFISPEAERKATNSPAAGAFFPEVAEASDLSVSAVPTGVETDLQMRDPEAPDSSTYEFTIPSDAQLVKDSIGGAQVTRHGKVLMNIPPPTALDVHGESVPAELTVQGDRLSISVSPRPDSSYPILVDPLLETYNWQGEPIAKGVYAPHPNSYGVQNFFTTNRAEQWSPEETHDAYCSMVLSDNEIYTTGGASTSGLEIEGPECQPEKWMMAGEGAFWVYAPPHYWQQQEEGKVNEGYIQQLKLWNLKFSENRTTPSPYMTLGLLRQGGASWESVLQHPSGPGGSIAAGPTYEFTAKDSESKLAYVGLQALENIQENSEQYGKGDQGRAWLYVGSASVALSEPEASVPKIGSFAGPEEWLNNTPQALHFRVADAGLGVYSMHLASGRYESSQLYGCTGIGASPCPLEWSSAAPGAPQVMLDPTTLATGKDSVSILATDPLGHKSATTAFTVKVDHTAPAITLSGQATEEERLGPDRSTYQLSARAVDGTSVQPQSGVSTEKIELNGHVVATAEPHCATENCEVTLKANLTQVSPYAVPGVNHVTVIATDAVGNETTKQLELMMAAAPPTLKTSGTLVNQQQVGPSRPAYTLSVDAESHEAISPVVNSTPTYQSTFGTAGTGLANFNHPGAIARDAKGDLWVADVGNHRLLEFTETGTPIPLTGWAAVASNLSSPSGVAITASGRIVVLDKVSDKFFEVNEHGEFILSAGGTGTGEGKMLGATSIAVASTGSIWVADSGLHRLDVFSEGGTFQKTIPLPGSNAEVSSIAPTRNGGVWVDEPATGKVYEVTASGEVGVSLRTGPHPIESAATPIALTVDSSGNIWVAGGGNRIYVFDEAGWFLREFGTAGTGAGALSLEKPAGIVTDSSGHVWITNAGNNRVDKWSYTSGTAGSVEVSILIDGKNYVTPILNACGHQTCSIEKALTVSTAGLSVGTHTWTVKVKDQPGSLVEESGTFEVSPDTTKPTITASGPLIEAPEGWVEQEAYPLKVEATDGGSGVASLKAKIDGSVVAEKAQACGEGGCSLGLNTSISMAAYAGGAHKAELIATDGAGNVQTKTWNINVDPQGRVTSAEVEATLEAVEETSESVVVASNEEIEKATEAPASSFPTVNEGVTNIVSSGTQDTAEISKTESGSFASGLPEGTISVTAVGQSPGASTPVASQESLVVTGNAQGSVDTITRPVFNGVMQFQSIREESSPDEFSWEVELWSGQTLVAVDEEDAEVLDKDGKELFLITAEPAHDAVGTNIPTTLSVKGNVITLHVNFRGRGAVFPVISGTGWIGGITTEYVSAPMDEGELEALKAAQAQKEWEEAERVNREEVERAEAWENQPPSAEYIEINRLGPPQPVAPTDKSENPVAVASSASSWHPATIIEYEYTMCMPVLGCAAWKLNHWGFFRFNGQVAWYKPSGAHPHCEHASKLATVTLEYCDFSGNNYQRYGAGYHLSSQDLNYVHPGGAPVDEPQNITEYMYGDGYAEGHRTAHLCNPLSSC
jgi:streptogramin lyase